MHITKTPSRRPCDPPPKLLGVIASLESCPIDDIPSIVDEFRTWTWPKSDLYLWTTVLNRFDDILKDIIDEFNFESLSSSLDQRNRSLLLAVLEFSKLLLENTSNKSIYNSCERLNSLLCSSDLDILIASLWVLLRCAQRAFIQRSTKIAMCVSAQRLTTLSLPFASAKMVAMIDESFVPNDSEFEVDFSFYRQKSADLPEGLCAIKITKDQLSKDIVTKIIDQHRVPPLEPLGSKPFPLPSSSNAEPPSPAFVLHRSVLVALNIADCQSRRKLIGIRMLALATVLHFNLNFEFQQRIFVPDLINDVCDVIPIDNEDCYDIKTAACHSIHVLANIRPRVPDCMAALNANSSHGVLLTCLRKMLATLSSNQASPKQAQFFDALNALVMHLVCTVSGPSALLASAVMPTLVSVFDALPINYTQAAKCLQLIDSVVYCYQSTFAVFRECGGVQKLIETTAFSVTSSDNLWKNSEIGRIMWVKTAMRLILHMMNEFTSTETRNLVDSSLPKTLLEIFSNPRLSAVCPLTINILSTLLHRDPTSLSILQEYKLPQTLVEQLSASIPPSIELMNAIPTVFGAFCLNHAGLDNLKNSSLIETFFDCFVSFEHAAEVPESEQYNTIASTLDEFCRHQPSFAQRIADNIKRIIQIVVQNGMLTHPSLDLDSEYVCKKHGSRGFLRLNPKQRPRCARRDLCKVLEGILKLIEAFQNINPNSERSSGIYSIDILKMCQFPCHYPDFSNSAWFRWFIKVSRIFVTCHDGLKVFKDFGLLLDPLMDDFEMLPLADMLAKQLSKDAYIENIVQLCQISALVRNLHVYFSQFRTIPRNVVAIVHKNTAEFFDNGRIEKIARIHKHCIEQLILMQKVVAKNLFADQKPELQPLELLPLTENVTSDFQATLSRNSSRFEGNQPSILPPRSFSRRVPINDTNIAAGPLSENLPNFPDVLTKYSCPSFFNHDGPESTVEFSANARSYALCARGVCLQVHRACTQLVSSLSTLSFSRRNSESSSRKGITMISKMVATVIEILFECPSTIASQSLEYKKHVTAIVAEVLQFTPTCQNHQALILYFLVKNGCFSKIFEEKSDEYIVDLNLQILLYSCSCLLQAELPAMRALAFMDGYDSTKFMVHVKLCAIDYIKSLDPYLIISRSTRTTLKLIGHLLRQDGESLSVPRSVVDLMPAGADNVFTFPFPQFQPRQVTATPELVTVLTEMGFSANVAERALVHTMNDVNRAAEYILAHPELEFQVEHRATLREDQPPVPEEPVEATPEAMDIEETGIDAAYNSEMTFYFAENPPQHDIQTARTEFMPYVFDFVIKILSVSTVFVKECRETICLLSESQGLLRLFELMENNLTVYLTLICVLISEGSLKKSAMQNAVTSLPRLLEIFFKELDAQDLEETYSYWPPLLYIFEATLDFTEEPYHTELPRITANEIMIYPPTKNPNRDAVQQIFTDQVKVDIARKLLWWLDNHSKSETSIANGDKTVECVFRLLIRVFRYQFVCNAVWPEIENPARLFSSFDDIDSILQALRTIIESSDAQFLEHVMRCEFRRFFEKMPSLLAGDHDPSTIVNKMSTLALRSPPIFTKIIQEFYVASKYEQGSRNFILKAKTPLPEPQKTPENPVAVRIMEDFVTQVLLLRNHKDAPNSKKILRQRLMLLKIIAELALSYNVCKMAIIEGAKPKRKSQSASKHAKTNFLSYLIEELLPWTDVVTVKEMSPEVRKELLESDWAENVIACLCVNCEGEEVENDSNSIINHIRRTVISALHCAFLEPVPDDFGTRFGRYLPLADLVYRILKMPSNPRSRTSNQTALSTNFLLNTNDSEKRLPPTALVKLFIEKEFIPLLTEMFDKIDMHHPQAAFSIDVILKPLDYLSELSVKISSADSVESASESVGIVEEIDSHTEDALRHSSLGILEPMDDEEINDNADEHMAEEDNDEETGYDEIIEEVMTEMSEDDEPVDIGMNILIQHEHPHQLLAQHDQAQNDMNQQSSLHSSMVHPEDDLSSETDNNDSDSSEHMDILDSDNEVDMEHDQSTSEEGQTTDEMEIDGLSGWGPVQILEEYDSQESADQVDSSHTDSDAELHIEPEITNHREVEMEERQESGEEEEESNVNGFLEALGTPIGASEFLSSFSNNNNSFGVVFSTSNYNPFNGNLSSVPLYRFTDGIISRINDNSSNSDLPFPSAVTDADLSALFFDDRSFLGQDIPGSQNTWARSHLRHLLNPSRNRDLRAVLNEPLFESGRNTISLDLPTSQVGHRTAEMESFSETLRQVFGNEGMNVLEHIFSNHNPGFGSRVDISVSGDGSNERRIIVNNHDPIQNNFTPIVTIERWNSLASMIFSSPNSERASHITSSVMVKFLPQVLELKQARDERDRQRRVQATQEAEAERQAAEEAKKPETQEQTQLIFDIGGMHVDLSGTGIDPTFLQALPVGIREEVILQYLTDSSGGNPRVEQQSTSLEVSEPQEEPQEEQKPKIEIPKLLTKPQLGILVGLLVTVKGPTAYQKIIALLTSLASNLTTRNEIICILLRLLNEATLKQSIDVFNRKQLPSSDVFSKIIGSLILLTRDCPGFAEYFVAKQSRKTTRSEVWMPPVVNLINLLAKSQHVEACVELLSTITKKKWDTKLQIPDHSIYCLVHVLEGDCPFKTFMLLLHIFLSLFSANKDKIIQKLISAVKKTTPVVADTLKSFNEKFEAKEPIEPILASFHKASSIQARFLRLIKMTDLVTIRASADLPAFDFMPIWKLLSKSLEFISDRDDLSTLMLPLIETFMVVEARTHDPYFNEFAIEHRKLLNYLVRTKRNLLSGSFSILVKTPKVLEFDNKRNYFYQQLHSQKQRRSHLSNVINLNVRRSSVFDDSYLQLQHKSGEQIRNSKIIVHFYGEEGVDGGGLAREWYSVLSRQIFNPDYALFKASAVDKVTYQPNRSSWVNNDHLRYFNFVGRFIGKAVYDHKLLDCYFTRSFYKHILGRPVDLKDLEAVDPNYYKSLQWMLENNIEGVFTLTFSTEIDDFGGSKVLDLCPNGRDIEVNNENKHEYVKLIVEQELTVAISDQIQAFLSGFYEIVPLELLKLFNEQELELLISGMPEIDVDDWKNNTAYVNYTCNSTVIQWFWRAVRSFDQEQRAKLVQYCTGTSKVPLEGFKALQGSDGPQIFQIVKDPGGPHRLPSAHTCFNQLDLPEYESYDKLREMILRALDSAVEGFGLA